jgi:hypothetical protein
MFVILILLQLSYLSNRLGDGACRQSGSSPTAIATVDNVITLFMFVGKSVMKNVKHIHMLHWK